MHRLAIAALALLLVPAASADEATGPLDDIVSPPGEACEVTAEWFGDEDIVEVGFVWDSHNCGGIGYRFGEGVDCNEDVLPCEGWIWIYGGAAEASAVDASLISPWGERACEAGALETDLGIYSIYTISDHNCGGVGWQASDGILCHPDFWYLCGGWIWIY